MDLNKDELLAKAKAELKNEVSTIAYETWIKSLGIKSISGNNIVFSVNSVFQKDFIENRYSELILNTLKFLTNREWSFSVVDVSSEPETSSASEGEAPVAVNPEVSANKATLKPECTFDSFVVGDTNRLAQAAALAVCDNPGSNSYNPLFLYGGVGLGKTHLMHAIGNRILEMYKNFNVLYVTSETFTNQLINAIQENKNEVFRNKYRNIDVLLIDDIQFIANKVKVQEEFFHTFNALYDAHKQIVISSDRPPREISTLEERLRSRFDWGLPVDIGAPDYETRFAILRKKAQSSSVVIDDLILSNIANSVDSNVRDLEGIFNKIVARATLTHSPITLELAESMINEFIAKHEKVISADSIKETVAKYFSISKADLESSKRSNDVTFPRQIAMFLCRSVANLSFDSIGKSFGNRDHSTVMHGFKKIESEVKSNNNTRMIVDSVKKIITNDIV